MDGTQELLAHHLGHAALLLLPAGVTIEREMRHEDVRNWSAHPPPPGSYPP